jgi:hypothetical protein
MSINSYNYASSKVQVAQPVKPLNGSERMALKHGFEMIEDSSAYNGRYFVKNSKKWIHNIAALRGQLGANDKELIAMDYDVATYYLAH